jgi:putative nucleotidyltransferase with HDIG domain
MQVRPTQTSLRTVPASIYASAVDDALEQGQALERKGQRTDARAIYEQALRTETTASPAQRGQLLRRISRAWMLDGDYAKADEAANSALKVAEEAADEASRGSAINMLATIQWQQGHHDEAQRRYLQARASAHAIGDARLAAMTASNLGVIATVRGNDAEALAYYESGLIDARGAGLVDEVMTALINLGQLHTHMHRFVEADRAFSEVLGISQLMGDLAFSVKVEIHIAHLRVKEGKVAEARDACDRARSLAQQIGDTHTEGDAEHVSGLIAKLEGDIARAETHLLNAERIAVRRKDMILQGETARELAEMYRASGRNRDTLHRLNQAHRLFQQLRARRELADVDRRTSQLESDFLDVVRKWGESIESKDIYTQGHCLRVADLSCALWARVMPENEINLFWFRIGALLHDVGKIVVPPEVLNKPGKLTADEWNLMKSHTTAGVELLADIEFPVDVRPIVESHHERWDGRGYPHGIAGEEIPITARVLCIADVYDALTSQRSYKQAFSHDDAIEIMRGDVGLAFDPELFAAFEGIVRRGSWRNTPAKGMKAFGATGS